MTLRVNPAVLRAALWTTAVANLAVAAMLLFPQSTAGRLAGLPQEPSPLVLRAMLALMIAMFGLAYAWLARREPIDRALLGFAAIGKFGAFGLVSGLWIAGQASGRFALLMCGDLVFAALFAAWLLGAERRAP
ncbi:MAG: hypothetical protein ACREUE_00050 [Panacagrimonas sp.]